MHKSKIHYLPSVEVNRYARKQKKELVDNKAPIFTFQIITLFMYTEII